MISLRMPGLHKRPESAVPTYRAKVPVGVTLLAKGRRVTLHFPAFRKT